MNNSDTRFSILMRGMSKSGGGIEFPSWIEDGFRKDERIETAMLKIGLLHLWEKSGKTLPETGKLPAPSTQHPEHLPEDIVNAIRYAIFNTLPLYRTDILGTLSKNVISLPHELLVDALEFGKQNKPYSKFIRKILGERGLWLAKQNPEWAFAVPSNEKDIWEHGGTEQRLDFFSEARKTDGSKANDLLFNEIDKMGTQEKLSFLDIIEHGLNTEDEPVLEVFLRQRNRDVKSKSAAMLSKIKGKRFMDLISSFMQPLLTTKKSFLSTTFDIEAPENHLPEFSEVGIETTKTTKTAIGERADILRQIAELLPLKWWETTTGMTPDELIRAAEKMHWGEPILFAWATAFKREPDNSWGKAFIENQGTWKTGDDGAILVKLDDPDAETAFLSKLMNAKQSAFGGELQNMCNAFAEANKTLPKTLSIKTGTLILEQCQNHDYALPKSIIDFSCLAAPSTLGGLSEFFRDAKPNGETMTNSIIKSLEIMHHRNNIFSHFQNKEQQ